MFVQVDDPTTTWAFDVIRVDGDGTDQAALAIQFQQATGLRFQLLLDAFALIWKAGITDPVCGRGTGPVLRSHLSKIWDWLKLANRF